MAIAATILIVLAATAVVMSHAYTLRVADFEPRPEQSIRAEIDRAKGLRTTAMTFAVAAIIAGAMAIALDRGVTITWIGGSVIMVCALLTLHRAASEPLPAIWPQ